MHEITSIQAPLTDFNSVPRIEGFERIKSEYSSYLSDESKLSAGPFNYLFFPSNETQLCAVVKELGRQKTKITIAGARTGLAGGSVPDQGALISMEKINQILNIRYHPQADEWRVRAGCGVSLSELNQCLRTKSFPDMEHKPDETLQDQLNAFKQDSTVHFYPPDPTEMNASLGGTLATNASGARTYRYGPTRDWVRGIRVVLANGEILTIPRGKYFASPSAKFCVYNTCGEATELTVADYEMPRTKCTSGLFAAPHMDLIDLFIGSEGTLGIITTIEVGLLPYEPRMAVILFLDSDAQAIDLTESLRENKRLRLDLIEFYSQNALDLLRRRQREDPGAMEMPGIPDTANAALFIEFFFDPTLEESPIYDALEETLESYGVSMARSWAAYEPEKMLRFRRFRHALPETVSEIISRRKKQYPDLHRVSADLAVPDACLRDMWQVYKSSLENASLQWLAYGHIGNSHLHVNVLPRDMNDLHKALELYRHFAHTAVGFGGTISAEHGIGKIKTKFLPIMFDEAQICQMRDIKRALDPEGLFSPGNIFSSEAGPA